MTAQISDYCIYNSEEYAIIGKTDWFAFNPEVFGMVRGRCSTAVGKRYWAGYEIRDLNQLKEKAMFWPENRPWWIKTD